MNIFFDVDYSCTLEVTLEFADNSSYFFTHKIHPSLPTTCHTVVGRKIGVVEGMTVKVQDMGTPKWIWPIHTSEGDDIYVHLDGNMDPYTLMLRNAALKAAPEED